MSVHTIPADDMARHAFRGQDVAADLRERYGYDGPLAAIYAGHDGPILHKWHHYLPLYDRYLSRWRGRPLRFLEIGVSHGGSLTMWRRFFGPQATIFGIDIDPDCAALDGRDAQVRIGSQADPEFLGRVVDEMGGIDVVVDDGSHEMAHLPVTLRTLFPRLGFGGLYIIEDLHTAYWERYGGGPTARGNFFNLVRPIIDDMHRWYQADYKLKSASLAGTVAGVHVHDSMMVLEKAAPHPPVHSMVGRAR